MKNRIKSMVEGIERYKTLYGTVCSVSAIILNKAFQLAVYQYNKGIYDFWGIPEGYIESNYVGDLSNLLYFLAWTIIVMASGNIYCYYFFTLGNHRKKVVKVFIKLGMIGIVWLIAIIILFVLMAIDIGVKETFEGVVTYPKSFFLCTVPVSCTLFGLLLMGNFKWWDYSTERKDKQVKPDMIDKKYRNRRVLCMLIGICLMVVGFLGAGASLYSSGESKANSMEYFDIVSIDKKYYVVIEMYGDDWILKQCSQPDEEKKKKKEAECKPVPEDFKIEKNYYRVDDIRGYDVKRYSLEERVSEYWGNIETEISPGRLK